MYLGPDRRKAQPLPKDTELTGDGHPWRTAASVSSPLNRRDEQTSDARTALTTRQRLLLQAVTEKSAGEAAAVH